MGVTPHVIGNGSAFVSLPLVTGLPGRGVAGFDGFLVVPESMVSASCAGPRPHGGSWVVAWARIAVCGAASPSTPAAPLSCPLAAASVGLGVCNFVSLWYADYLGHVVHVFDMAAELLRGKVGAPMERPWCMQRFCVW